jgi:electron transport complex protein RnfE
MTTRLKTLWLDGLWSNNPALVQLLGLCPLLAVSTTAINGLSLGIATMATVIVSNFLVASIRHWLIQEIRIPIFVLLIAGAVTCIDLVMNAWWHELYLTLGIFIPLIITNCAILARAEAFASRNSIGSSVVDGIATGLGFALVLTLLGGIRELLGQGTLLSDAHLLFGETAKDWQLSIAGESGGLLAALLPPGAFIILGLMLATRNLLIHDTASTANDTTELTDDSVLLGQDNTFR